MKNLLVTGCNGQLGNELQLIAAHYPQFHYIYTDIAELDICNEGQVKAFIEQNKVDVVVNCAAFTAVDKAESETELCMRLNHLAPGYLAGAVQARGGVMVQVSTDYVFDGTGHLPYKEDDATCPNTVYGRTKLSGEQAVMDSCDNYVIIRTAWLYSKFGKNFVKTMMRLGEEKENLGVVFDQIGSPTYARDLAVAIMEIVSQKLVVGIYHFSNEGVISWYDFTKAIHRAAGITTCQVRPLHTEDYPAPAPRPHYSVLDKTKIKETFGLEIPYWLDSLEECVAALKQA